MSCPAASGASRARIACAFAPAPSWSPFLCTSRGSSWIAIACSGAASGTTASMRLR